MSYTRVAAVTGANKGIGQAIVRNLALQYPKSSFNNGPLLIYLTARDQSRGEEAVKSLQSDSQLKRAKALSEDGGLTTIRYHQMDISDNNSIDDFAAFLKKEHPDGIDFAVNNAGIAMDGFGELAPRGATRTQWKTSALISGIDLDANVVKQTLHTNYYGTLEATRQFLPVIRDGGRLVNVSSMAGLLNKYSNNLRKSFLDAKTVPEITALMENFKEAVNNGNEKQQGWPSAAYAVSKAGTLMITYAGLFRNSVIY